MGTFDYFSRKPFSVGAGGATYYTYETAPPIMVELQKETIYEVKLIDET